MDVSGSTRLGFPLSPLGLRREAKRRGLVAEGLLSRSIGLSRISDFEVLTERLACPLTVRLFPSLENVKLGL